MHDATIDAVARAIAGEHTPLAKWEGRSPEAQAVFRAMATAAIAAMPSNPCPHLTGRTTQWCALGQTTAESDRALMKIGAALWCDGIESALDTLYAAGRALGQTLADRARELAQEGQDG